MARRLRPVHAIAAVAVVLGAAAVAMAVAGNSSDAAPGVPAATSQAAAPREVMPRATGSLGGAPVHVRVIGAAGTSAQAGATVTVVATTSAPLDRMTITGPGGAALPAMTGALLISRTTGDIDAPTATTHGHGHTQGQGVAAALGATGVFAAKISPGASTVAVDSQGTRLAAAYAQSGTVETVDLVRATRPERNTAIANPTSVWFAPSGQDVWVNDADAGVRVLRASGTVSGVIGGAPGRNVVAFSPARGVAVIAGEGTNEAVVVRTSDHARTATLDLPAPATSAAFVQAPPAIAVTHADGSLSVAPLDRTSGAPYRIQTGFPGGAGATAVVTPDGRRAAVLLPDSRRLAVIDLRRRRLLTTVGTGRDPRGLVLLQQRFAVTRSASDPTATWVDVRTPSRAADLPLGDRPATSMALTDAGTRLLFADPGARQVLDVHSMMGRPMVMGVIPGTFAPDDIASFPGGMRRSGPREYRRTVVLPADGAYRVTLSSPDGEFTATMGGTRPRAARTAIVATHPSSMRRGTRAPVTVRVSGPPARLVGVLMVSSGRTGVHQVRARAVQRSRAWVATVRPTVAGTYTVFPVVDGGTMTGGAEAPPVIEVTP